MVATQTHDGIDALWENQQQAASQGTGHVSGCGVTATSNQTALTFDVASGTVRVSDATVNVGSASVSLGRADGNFPRKDLIVADDAGNVVTRTGRPTRPDSADLAAAPDAVRRTASPAPPDLHENSDWQDHVVLAIVWVPARIDGSADLDSGDVWERTVPPVKAGTGTVINNTVSKTGDGTTTQFDLDHGFGSTPPTVMVEPTTAAAATDFWEVSKDATHVTIEYATAPANGASLGWQVTSYDSVEVNSGYTDADARNAINTDSDHGSTASHDYFSGDHADLSNVQSDQHHSRPTTGTGLAESGGAFQLDVTNLGQLQLSSGSATVDTNRAVDDQHYMVALSPQDGADVAASLEDDTGGTGNYLLHLEENSTSVGNPTVGWKLILV